MGKYNHGGNRLNKKKNPIKMLNLHYNVGIKKVKTSINISLFKINNHPHFLCFLGRILKK